MNTHPIAHTVHFSIRHALVDTMVLFLVSAVVEREIGGLRLLMAFILAALFISLGIQNWRRPTCKSTDLRTFGYERSYDRVAGFAQLDHTSKGTRSTIFSAKSPNGGPRYITDATGGTSMYYDLSIIIPTYKRPELLTRTLESIAPSTSCNYEVIVIDDCPEGSGFAPARLFNTKYYCKAGSNRGLSASRNIGIGLARGKYLSFIDDDDFYNPQGLDALLGNIQKNETLIFGNYCVLTATDMSLNELSEVTLDHMLVRNHIPVGTYLIEKASIVSDFSENMRSHEDWDFLLNQMTKNGMAYAQCAPVTIDKTRNTIDSMRSRREEFFWLDYLTVYSRHPAPHLSQLRSGALQGLGLSIPENLLSFGDVI